MKSKFCLPIIKESEKLVIETIENNMQNYDAFEVWIDYINDLSPSFLNKLGVFDKKIIVILRRKNLEPIKMYLPNRLKYLQEIYKTKLWLDLDVTQIDEIKLAKKINLEDRLIISFHDYSNTPDNSYLEKIIDKIRELKPAVIKLSTFCKNGSDSLRLLAIKRNMLEAGDKHIILGMGEHGKITRVFGALWSNELTYTPESDEESSAEGQINRAEFSKILERIEDARK